MSRAAYAGTCALLAAAALAGPVQFSGSVLLSGEQSFVSGDDSLLPPRSELSLALSPTLSLWAFPFAVNFLMTTSGNNFGEELNRYSFLLRPAEWARGLVGAPGFLLGIKGLELGACNPSFSRLSLSGATVNGGALELEPWNIHLAATAGLAERPVEQSDSTAPRFRRMLYGAKFGYGRQENTHFHLTAAYAKDDPNSITVFQRLDTTIVGTDTLIDTVDAVTPYENIVLGAEFYLNVAKGLLTLESEVVGSEVTRDNRTEVVHFDWLPDWVESTFRPRASTSVDFAYRVRPTLKVLETRIYGELEMVGPGFQSLGAPSLRNDNLAWRAGIDRGFADNQVFAAVSYATERDNLLTTTDSAGQRTSLKAVTTRHTLWTADLSLNFAGLPYLQVGLIPSRQYSGDDWDRADVVSVSAGYDFAIGAATHSPSVSVSWQGHNSSTAGGRYTAVDVSPSYTAAFGLPLSVSVGGCYATTGYAGDSTEQLVSVDLSPSYTLGSWTNTMSLSGSFDDAGTKFGARLGSTFPVWRIAAATVGVEYGNYAGDDGRYGEFRVTAALSKSW